MRGRRMTHEQVCRLWCRMQRRAERLAYVLMAANVYAWDIGPEVYAEARTLAREVRRYREAHELNP